MSIIIAALLPVFVTVLPGYVAACHNGYDSASSNALNPMVLTYTLPLSLIAGTLTRSRHQLAGNLPMRVAMFAGLAIPVTASLIVSRHVFHRGLGDSTIQALGISLGAVPFTGLPVLDTIFGSKTAALTVAIGCPITNLLIVPVSTILLTLAAEGNQHAKPAKTAPTRARKMRVPWFCPIAIRSPRSA